MTDLAGKAVLTTGANSGIGLATAVTLATLGFRSIGTVRSEAKADAVIAAAKEAGVRVETVLLDVTDAMRCAEVVNRVRPWAIVNNAGYSGVGAIEDVSDDEARHQLETMVVAPMRLARLALPHMRAAGDGRIVNVSSIYGLTTTPFSGWYQASKHALEAASDALRLEVARSLNQTCHAARIRATRPPTIGFEPSSSRLRHSWENQRGRQRSSPRLSLRRCRMLGTSWAGMPR